MLQQEFFKLTGVELSAKEYEKVENAYMGCTDDKRTFCKKWLKEYKAKHSLSYVLAFMDGIAAVGNQFVKYDTNIDKEMLIASVSETNMFCIRRNGTHLTDSLSSVKDWVDFYKRGKESEIIAVFRIDNNKGIYTIKKIDTELI